MALVHGAQVLECVRLAPGYSDEPDPVLDWESSTGVKGFQGKCCLVTRNCIEDKAVMTVKYFPGVCDREIGLKQNPFFLAELPGGLGTGILWRVAPY